MKSHLLSLLLFLVAATAAAQELPSTDAVLTRAAAHGWRLRLGAGLGLGGTSPLPLPAEIRHINKYQPDLNFTLEGAVERQLAPRWGLRLGLRFENKGMKTDARVKNYHMEAINTEGTGAVVGAWTGNVKTEVSNNYLTVPLVATYKLSPRWQLSAGPYVAWMMSGHFSGEAYDGYIRDQDPTGEKAEVTRATYNFSDRLRRFHWGVQAGGEYRAYEHLAVGLNLQWGLNGIFPSDFESVRFALYPIYANLMFHYIF